MSLKKSSNAYFFWSTDRNENSKRKVRSEIRPKKYVYFLRPKKIYDNLDLLTQKKYRACKLIQNNTSDLPVMNTSSTPPGWKLFKSS